MAVEVRYQRPDDDGERNDDEEDAEQEDEAQRTDGNEVMPSQANPNMRLSGYFDSPAKRAARSYSTVAWRYPSDFTMPRRKRLRSG